jgi:hypothetical protein
MEIMKTLIVIKISLIVLLFGIAVVGCKKDEKNYPDIPDAVYIVAKVNTGPYPGAVTAVGNTASGAPSIPVAGARVYVNTPKDYDVVVNFTISGTAVVDVNYTMPTYTSVTIPAGQYTGEILIPIKNVAVAVNKTIIITLTSASNKVELGLGSVKAYKNFTYTITKP